MSSSLGGVGGLVDFVPALSPEFERPGHLGELGELFAAAASVCRGEGALGRVVVLG
jgi:hypothetical protein